MGIGDAHFDALVAAAPEIRPTKVDWAGVQTAMQSAGVSPGSVVATSWCDYNEKAPPMWGGEPCIAVIHPSGILATAGKKKLLGGGIKGITIDFAMCREFGAIEDADERGFGKFCIAFAGPGSVLLGILEWHWSAKRFRDPRPQMMAAAEERDRIQSVVSGLIG